MDHVTIGARLNRIAALATELRAAVRCGFEGYAASPELQAATERRLHAALHSAVNAASLVIVGRQWGMPESARDALQALADHAVLEGALVGRLKKAVDLRDQLAHDDLGLTPARVHVHLEGVVRDLDAFREHLETWLEDQTLNEPGH